MASAEAIPLAGAGGGGPPEPRVRGKGLPAHDLGGEACSAAKEEGNGRRDTAPCLAIVPYRGAHQCPDRHNNKPHLPAPPSSPYSNCRDCGNRAKKDCHHQRCRTCCRKRGFSCPTHVESTWVSAAKRREKLQESSAVLMPHAKKSHLVEQDGLNGVTCAAPTSAAGSPRDLEIKPLQPAKECLPSACAVRDECSTANIRENLPLEVRTFAMFKCVRVTGIADEHDEFAYRATVEIGGRVFKGVLYEQDMEKNDNSTCIQLEVKGSGT